MLSALGLAGTQSSGVWAFLDDGANCKSLHPGRSAVNGCLAAQLAKAGMIGSASILTSKDGGLFSAMSDDTDESQVSQGLGETWEICNMDHKPYPCCRSAHCAIDAALALSKRGDFSVADIDNIVIDTYEIGKIQCANSAASYAPQTAEEARFSTPYTVAVALLKGNVGLDHFSPEMLAANDVRELIRKIEVRACTEFTSRYPRHWGCRMSIQLTDSRKLITEVKDAFGSLEKPMSKQELSRKAQSLIPPDYTDDTPSFLEQLADIRRAESVYVL
jgi:2-methylcitrate dehydratase PrpD